MVMKTSLTDLHIAPIVEKLRAADAAFIDAYPGYRVARQPVQTLYGGAQLFRSDSIASIGRRALETLRQYAPDASTLAAALGLSTATADAVYARVVAKLKREPIEDYRIDFEDGFGHRPDAEEDEQAVRTANELARAMENNTLPPFAGIRIKPLTPPLRARAIRTLDLFLTTLLDHTGAKLPAGFVVTLPKISMPEEVSALADIFDAFESVHHLEPNCLSMEIMIETPQVIVNRDGACGLPALVDAARGRCRGAHFGPFDYTSACNITAAHQSLLHPACDHARQTMLVSLAHRGVFHPMAPPTSFPFHAKAILKSSTGPGTFMPPTSGTRSKTDSIRVGICTPRSSPVATPPSTRSFSKA